MRSLIEYFASGISLSSPAPASATPLFYCSAKKSVIFIKHFAFLIASGRCSLALEAGNCAHLKSHVSCHLMIVRHSVRPLVRLYVGLSNCLSLCPPVSLSLKLSKFTLNQWATVSLSPWLWLCHWFCCKMAKLLPRSAQNSLCQK